jgi:hypothetical protein
MSIIQAMITTRFVIVMQIYPVWRSDQKELNKKKLEIVHFDTYLNLYQNIPVFAIWLVSDMFCAGSKQKFNIFILFTGVGMRFELDLI